MGDGRAPAGRAPAGRTSADWTSPRGLRTDSLPWHLWEKAKRLMWNPADLDMAGDAAELAALPTEARLIMASLARGFMIGEEGVTLDILPLIQVMADEGRLEEVIYLTSFAFEEAKHVDFFCRWVDAAGMDFAELDEAVAASYRRAGSEVPLQRDPIFEEELPQVMRRLLTDRSAEAVLDASVTYNQFVEGGLAIAGYRVWDQLFQRFDALHGLQRGLTLVRRDESRHITYGTYLCRRLIAADPGLLEVATARLRQLHRVFGGGSSGGRPGGAYGAGAAYRGARAGEDAGGGVAR
ncbi:MAG: R2-like ligand-binding oxidase, partial [Acidimicrobiales bacterium]